MVENLSSGWGARSCFVSLPQGCQIARERCGGPKPTAVRPWAFGFHPPFPFLHPPYSGPCYGPGRRTRRPMTISLPPNVAITELPDGARFRLLARPWGQPAWIGLGALVGGVFGAVFISFWLWGVGSPLLLQGWQPGDG